MRHSIWIIFKSVLGLTLLAVITLAAYTGYKRIPEILKDFSGSSQTEKTKPGQEVVVTIPKGASLSQVAGILQDKGIISSRFVFRAVAFIRGEQRKIKAGDYDLKTGSDAGDVLDLLISGKTLMFSITIPEGYDLLQISELVGQAGIMPKEEFLVLCKDRNFIKELKVEAPTLEGYVFPDTYFFRPSEKGEGKVVLRRMVQRFQNIYDKNVKAVAEANSWTQHQVVTLASLIEKEARSHEHNLVSAVFHNRLKQNMKLQSDPTVIYGIKPMGSKITREDLNRKHPYNTYQNVGLPPGPIASPGKESLLAATQPAEVDYLYFVAKNDGRHQFSSNLKEHNKWVNVYQRNMMPDQVQ